MLAPNTPFWGLPCGVTRYWQLRIAKNFHKPKYYIGQTVTLWSKLSSKDDKKVPYRLIVIGILWSSDRWEYLLNIPENHPWFDDDTDFAFAFESEITPI